MDLIERINKQQTGEVQILNACDKYADHLLSTNTSSENKFPPEFWASSLTMQQRLHIAITMHSSILLI